MKTAAVPVLAWAALLTVLTVVLYVWAPDSELEWGLFAVAAGTAWAVGLVVLWRRHARRVRLPAQTGAGLLVAAGIVLAADALVLGWWLALIGGAVALIGVGLLVRETTA